MHAGRDDCGAPDTAVCTAAATGVRAGLPPTIWGVRRAEPISRRSGSAARLCGTEEAWCSNAGRVGARRAVLQLAFVKRSIALARPAIHEVSHPLRETSVLTRVPEFESQLERPQSPADGNSQHLAGQAHAHTLSKRLDTSEHPAFSTTAPSRHSTRVPQVTTTFSLSRLHCLLFQAAKTRHHPVVCQASEMRSVPTQLCLCCTPRSTA